MALDGTNGAMQFPVTSAPRAPAAPTPAPAPRPPTSAPLGAAGGGNGVVGGGGGGGGGGMTPMPPVQRPPMNAPPVPAPRTPQQRPMPPDGGQQIRPMPPVQQMPRQPMRQPMPPVQQAPRQPMRPMPPVQSPYQSFGWGNQWNGAPLIGAYSKGGKVTKETDMGMKAGNKKAAFGGGAKKMGGPGARLPRQSVGEPRGKAPPKKGTPMMLTDNDGDETMPAMKKGGKVKAMKKGGKC